MQKIIKNCRKMIFNPDFICHKCVPLSAFILVYSLASVPLFAEGNITPNPTSNTQIQAPSDATAGTAYRDVRQQAADPVALDYLFNKTPQDGTAGKSVSSLGGRIEDKIKALDALNRPGFEDQIVRGRFEKFLNAPESDLTLIEEYKRDYRVVLEHLRKNAPVRAWQHLYTLNEYPWDAGLSGELANRIESIWDASRATEQLTGKNERLRKAVQSANWNADLMYQTQTRREERGRAKPKSVPSKNTPTPKDVVSSAVSDHSFPQVAGSLQMTEQYLKSLEAKIRIRQNELKQEKIAAQVKSDFADTVSTLFASKRYRHVVIAAGFYRQVFGDGDYPSAMGAQVTKSVEYVRDIDEAVTVFEYQLEQKEIASATQTLQGAFLIGELDPAVRGIKRPLKRQVAKYISQISRMQNLIEARDFGPLEELMEAMKIEITDFDSSKPLSLVNAVKLESKMRLGKAKLAAQRGDQAQALEEFKFAAEAWPANPELESAASLFFEAQDVKNQGVTEFDRLITEQNYRSIFERQLPLLSVVKGDSLREEQLKTALEKVKESEVAIEKATMMQNNGNPFGAWEELELAAKKWPEDSKLNRMRAELSMRSAEFVSALHKAQEAEFKEQYGFSLNWYLSAQNFYPASQMAKDGIDRLQLAILPNSGK